MRTPIVFIHNKKASYMKPVIEQAKISNPGAEIVVFSSADTRLFYEQVASFRDINDYFTGAREFEKIYVHLSSLEYRLELIFLQRWFVLREFMEREGHEKLVYLDSDCMLYTDVNQEWDRVEGYDFANLDILCPAVTFIPRQGSIIKFCEFLERQYTVNKQQLVDSYRENFVVKGKPGGIGDMSQFSMFERTCGTILDLSRVEGDASYDSNMNETMNTTRGKDLRHLSEEEALGYEMDKSRNIKKILFRRGSPYGRLVSSGRLVQFRALHFQSAAKAFIPAHYTGPLLKKWLYAYRFKKEYN